MYKTRPIYQSMNSNAFAKHGNLNTMLYGTET